MFVQIASIRSGGLKADAFAKAGTMASSIGKASATPEARRNVRRESE